MAYTVCLRQSSTLISASPQRRYWRETGGGGERERERERPDEWCHVLIIPNSEKDVFCLELIDKVDPEQVGIKRINVTQTCQDVKSAISM